MNRDLERILIFFLGVGSGALLAKTYFKWKYEKIADEEITSVKEVYSRNQKDDSSNAQKYQPEKKPLEFHTNDVTKYNTIINSQSYSTEKEVTSAMGPRFISPDEFGDNEDYETISLTYYAGGNSAVIADENDEVIDPVESVGSIDIIAEHIGDYEDDCIHIRNDAKQCDYEILRDYRSYDEVVKEKPYLQNDMNGG